MKKLTLFTVSLILVCLGIGCRDVDTVIPKDLSKWDTDLKPAVAKLSDEDKHLFTGYVMRMKLTSALSGVGVIPEGTTIAKGISDQKAWLEIRKAQKAEEDALKAKVDTERQAMITTLNKSVTMVLQSWGQSPKDIHNHKFRDTFDFNVAVQNKSAKAIKGIQGDVTIKDTFGDIITVLKFSIEEDIAPGASYVGEFSKELNQFKSADVRLMNLEEGKFTSSAVPVAVVFADGTTVKAPD